MSVGKLQLSSETSTEDLTFYKYARTTLDWAHNSANSMMEVLSNDGNLNKIEYVGTVYIYIQLLAAYSASYCYYPFFIKTVPLDSLNESMKELKKGRDDGIKKFTINNQKIEENFIKMYSVLFNRYFHDGLMKDDAELKEDEGVYNPDMNLFAGLFLEDSNHLFKTFMDSTIDDIERYRLLHVIADIPLTTFEALSSMSMKYIPPKKGLFG